MQGTSYDALELTQYIILRWKNENPGTCIFLVELPKSCKLTKTVLKMDKSKWEEKIKGGGEKQGKKLGLHSGLHHAGF